MGGLLYALAIGTAPAPPDLLDAVQEIEIETSIEEASIFRLRIGIAQTAVGDWSVLEHDVFRPLLPVGIRIQVGHGVPEAVINGYVSGQQVTYADEPGQSVLEVTGMDVTMLMNLQEKVSAWPNMTDDVIAKTILVQYEAYSVVPEVEPTRFALVEPEATTTQRGTDIRFLRRLARRNGYECYVQPHPLTGIDIAHFGSPRLLGPPQAVLSVNMGPETNVSGFTVRYEMLRPTTATAGGLDPAARTPQTAAAVTALQPPLGREGTLTRVMPRPVIRLADTGVARTPELQAVAQAVVDRSTWAVVVEGQAAPELGVLRPGRLVNVRGAGRVFNGSYYVTRVMHTIGRAGYVQRFEARRNAVGMTGAELYRAP